jgi:hypothetical protein
VLTYPACLDQPPRNEVNVPGFKPLPVGARVSLRPQLVDYHLNSSGTANFGLAYDTTVGPGEQITYRWYARPNLTGLAMLTDFGDVPNHQHHGLYGALAIEPAGSTYLDPKTGQALVDPATGQTRTSSTQAIIVDPNGPDFRENIVLMNSDLSLFRRDTNGNPADDQPVPDNFDLKLTPSREADDPEDQGEFSINYRNEPWSHRYAADQNITNIFSSIVHGDPATPLFEAYAGDRTVFRVGQALGDARSTSFALNGHTWRRSPADPQSQIAASQGQFNPGVSYNIVLDPSVTGGAGGRRGVPGDYLYKSNNLARHLTGGQWGIFRVHGSARSGLAPLPDHPPAGAAGAGAFDPVPAWLPGSAFARPPRRGRRR